MKLVVVADDFGLCESVNTGILEAHQNGIVTELSLMLGSPGTEHALALVREHTIQNVGIHMLLKNWRDTGHLVHKPDYLKLLEELSQDEIAKLIHAELAEFEAILGRKPSHITSQYGIIGHPKALPTVIEYAVAHNTPMRLPGSAFTASGEIGRDTKAATQIRQAGATTTDHFFSHILGDDYEIIKQALEDDLATMKQEETAEICLHPGYVSKELKQSSSLVYERERGTKLATDPDFRQWVEGCGIKIVSYRKVN